MGQGALIDDAQVTGDGVYKRAERGSPRTDPKTTGSPQGAKQDAAREQAAKPGQLVLMRRRCFHCKEFVDANAPQSVMCREHLFAVFLCSPDCYVAHMKEHETGGAVK